MFTTLDDFPFKKVVGCRYIQPAFGEEYKGTITDAFEHTVDGIKSADFMEGKYMIYCIDLSPGHQPFTWGYSGSDIVIKVEKIGMITIKDVPA